MINIALNSVTTLHTPTMPVDRLGELKAQIKTLQDEAKAIEASMKADGSDRFEGAFFAASVSHSERTTVDWKAIAEKLEPSRQLVRAHTSTKPVVTVRVSAHRK